MKIPAELLPSKARFEKDPFGYSALAWHQWALVQSYFGGADIDIAAGPTAADLKSPVLWLTHAHAISEAAAALVRAEPDLSSMPFEMRSICHSQYHAVVLMLVGYSLEVVLKAMLIVKKGVDLYTDEEKQYRHHKLTKLADFIPNLSLQDKAALTALTHFIYWAGRYPDPGFGDVKGAEEIFTLSEAHNISAKDLFQLASRIMGHAKVVIG